MFLVAIGSLLDSVAAECWKVPDSLVAFKEQKYILAAEGEQKDVAEWKLS